MSNESNPFGNSVAIRPNTPAVSGGNALVQQETQRAIAEVQAAMILAKQFPRDQVSAMDRILNACQRQTLAETALYSYSRGGSDITGPSIRMAEAIAQNWGNVQYGIRELDQRNGESTVEAFAWDVETNTRQVKVFQVSHIRYTKSGQKKLEDPRDIYEMVANQGARRLRACILGIIPGDVVESAVNQCEETLKAKADTSPDAIKKLLAAFEQYHVTKSQIEAKIQRRIDAITPAQVVNLRKVYNSLKDGMSVAADWFEPAADNQTEEKAAPASRMEAVKQQIKKPAEVKKVEPPNEPQPDPAADTDLQQTVFRLLAQLADLKGDTPDDTIDTLTNGKIGCQQDLMDKPAAYLTDIKMIIETELAKSAEAAA